jgi:cardiolipin synthase
MLIESSFAKGSARAQLVVSSPSNPRGEALFVEAISGARRTIWITNPFVVPTERISVALVSAAREGVDVRMLVPGRYHRFEWVRDAMRGFYSRYLVAGVRIFEYEAAMLHAKTITVDRQWASVGSFNLDPRSFSCNDEAAVAACDESFSQAVADAFLADCENAREVKVSQWRNRGIAPRCRELAATLLRRHL